MVQIESEAKLKIIIEPYNPLWPKYYREEAKALKKVFNKELEAIHHVGSTSVKGLAAKPIIDIIPVVKNIQKVDDLNDKMEALGYEVKGEFGLPFRRFFTKRQGSAQFNVHVYEKHHPEISRMILLREYLKKHPADKKRYAVLKSELAQKFPDDINAYCEAKTDFIKEIDAKSGYKGFRIAQVLTREEFEAYHRIRKNEIFDRLKIEYDPNHPTLRLENHTHFVCRKNTTIIGVAEIEFLESQSVALRYLAIDSNFQNLGYGKKLLKTLEKWLKQKGITRLLTHAMLESTFFFKRLGYHEVASWEENPVAINYRIEIVDLEKRLVPYKKRMQTLFK